MQERQGQRCKSRKKDNGNPPKQGRLVIRWATVSQPRGAAKNNFWLLFLGFWDVRRRKQRDSMSNEEPVRLFVLSCPVKEIHGRDKTPCQ